jgi:hypothetical protein
MNGQHAQTEMTASRERYSYARLQGSWLLLARVGWVALVALTLGIFFASLPVYLAQLQTLCAGMACTFSLQLTPELAGALKGMGLSIGAYTAYTVALTLASVVMCLVVSTLIVWRRSHDRMALLVALMLVTLGPFIATLSVWESSSPWRVPNACLYFLTGALFVLVFLLFPNGQFVPRWMRWTFIVFLVGQVPSTFFRDMPFALNTSAAQVSYLLVIGEAAILAVVQLYRYRRVSSPLERQQTKWVVVGIAVPVIVYVSLHVLYLIFPVLALPGSLYPLAVIVVGLLLLLLIPLSFGFAMLRNRLWEIDVLINRTLVYGALTVSLTVVYVGLVIGLSALLSAIISQASSVAIVLSTLAIYFLFQPLRRRIQRIIDRRFYRSKYDAAKTVAAFSATLRQEVDLDQLREQLLAVVQETMQPAHVSLWLRPPEHDGRQRVPWRAKPLTPYHKDE